MTDQDREDTFLINAALGTELLTSYISAADSRSPRKATGCIIATIAAFAAVAATWALWVLLG